jgi:hypothetical protein
MEEDIFSEDFYGLHITEDEFILTSERSKPSYFRYKRYFFYETRHF